MSRRARLSEADRPPAGPVRTCVGCRERAMRSRLLRVVAVRVRGDVGVPDEVALVPDLLSRLPGRGAWVHPDPDCLDLAARRRAFPRALRVQGPVDDEAVRAAVSSTTSTTSTTANTVEIGSGSASDGHPMSSQR